MQQVLGIMVLYAEWYNYFQIPVDIRKQMLRYKINIPNINILWKKGVKIKINDSKLSHP